MTNSIMVCDDDPDFGDLVKHTLERNDHEIITVQSGEEALSKIEEEKPDLLLLDIGMPGIDGWEVLREMRRKGEIDDIPVAMLTGEEFNLGKFSRKEMDYIVDYLEKSSKIKGISEAVERLMKKTERIFDLREKIMESVPEKGEVVSDAFLTWSRLQMIHESLQGRLKQLESSCYNPEKRDRIEELRKEEGKIIQEAKEKKEEILELAGIKYDPLAN